MDLPVQQAMQQPVVNDSICLELIAPHHADALLALIDRQRPYLKQWLPWVGNMQNISDVQRYIDSCILRQDAGNEFGYMLMVNGEAAGRLGIYKLDHYNSAGEMGYWISEWQQGKGIMTTACRALVHQCFNILQLNRIEIRCAEHNYKSAAIPERLGFKYEGLLHEAEKLPGGYVNLKVYALLKSDYTTIQKDDA